jgi:elongation factor Ts
MTQVTAQLVKELRDRTGIGVSKCKEALEQAGGDIDLAIENLRKSGMAAAIKKEGRATKEGIIKTAAHGNHVALVEINAETDFVVKNERFQEFAQQIADEIAQTAPKDLASFLQQKSVKHPPHTIDECRASLVQTLGENIQIKRCEIVKKKPDMSIGVYSHAGGKLVTLVAITGSNSVDELAKEIAMHVAAESPEYLTHEEVPREVIEKEKEVAKAQIKNKPANILEKILEGKLNAYYNQVCLVQQPYIKDSSLSIAALVANKGKEIGKNLQVSYFLRWSIGV